MAGNGDATAITPGTPIRARMGVANAEPPAPNIPKTIPTPSPASKTSM